MSRQQQRPDGPSEPLVNHIPAPEVAEAVKPVLVVPLGRGQCGKSVFLRHGIDRARNAGREIIVADGDRSNQTLSAYYDDAVRAESAEDADIHVWITGLLEKAATDRVSVALDMAGGDRVLESYSKELPIVEFCNDAGILPVCVYFVAPNADSLAPIGALEASGAFRTSQTVVVLNEGLVPVSDDIGRAFASVKRHPTLRAVLERGGEIVVMPRLGCMPEVDRRRAHFYDDGGKLGPVDSFRVKHWRKAMDEAFAPVRHWLPW